jgi:NAD(P)-dependent dehydrogenase (short-subunit alcohol dehydrogenase family)
VPVLPAASVAVDLEQDEEIHELAARLRRDVGSIDLLVHSAGIISLGPVEQAPVEDFDRQYRTNVRGPYVLTQALLPMFRGSRGEVVFVNSSIGLSAKAGTAQYSATKHALKALADACARGNSDGRRVLSIFWDEPATPMQHTIHDRKWDYHPELLLQPEDVAAVVLSAVVCADRRSYRHKHPADDQRRPGKILMLWSVCAAQAVPAPE